MSGSSLSVERGWQFSAEKNATGAKDMCDMFGNPSLGHGDFVAALTARIANLKLGAMSGALVSRYV